MPALIVLKADSKDMRKLYADLKGVPGNLRVQLRRGIRDAAKPAVDRAKANAAWSTRIPGAIKVKPSFSAKSAGVYIVVDSKRAPHAAPYEHNGSPGTFRHPVYGDRENWVSEAARPFFYNSVGRDNSTDATAAIEKVMNQVAQMAGFR